MTSGCADREKITTSGFQVSSPEGKMLLSEVTERDNDDSREHLSQGGVKMKLFNK